jgi:hypothetical protein
MTLSSIAYIPSMGDMRVGDMRAREMRAGDVRGSA